MPLLTNLRAIREQALLSQDELAAMSGVTQAAISHAERGRPTRGFTARKLAKALGVAPSELVGAAPMPAPPPPPAATKRQAGPTLERARELAARYREEGDIDEAEHWERIAERVAAGTQG